MISAEVVDRADQIHPRLQCGGVPGPGPTPARKGGEALAKGGIKSFNVGGIEHPWAALGAATELFALCRCASHKAPLDPGDTPLDVVLDDLGNLEGFPTLPARPAGLPGRERVPKGFPDGAGVSAKPSGTDQQRAPGRTAADAAQQAADQSQIPLFADLPGQPQPRADCYCQRHPTDLALLLNADLIGLHLPQVPRLFDHVFLHGLGGSTRPCKPAGHGPLVEAKSHHNSLQRTAMGHQREHEADRLSRGPQPVEGRPGGRGEGLATLLADEAVLFARVNSDIALPSLASGEAFQIGTKCVSEVHLPPPGNDLAWAKSRTGPPLFLQIRFSTLKCRATTNAVEMVSPF